MSASASSSAATLIVVSERVCLPAVAKDKLVPAAIRIDVASGRITAIDTEADAIAAARAAASATVEVRDVGRLVLMSGLVDSHVHVRTHTRTRMASSTARP